MKIKKINFFTGLKKYRGRLSFLPVEPYVPPQITNNRSLSFTNKPSDISNSVDGLAYRRTQSMYTDIVQRDEQSPSSCAETSENNYRLGPSSTTSKMSLGNEIILNIQTTDTIVQTGDAVGNIGTAPLKLNAANNNSGGTIPDCSALNQTYVERNHLPPLGEHVPNNWVTIEEDFVFFTATLLSHLSSDTVVVPEAKINDGIIHLTMMRDGISRMNMLQMMSESADIKDHGFTSDYMERIKVKAFRLTPLTDHGIMTVDGEQVPYGPIQAHVMPEAARLMCRPI